MPEPSGKRLRHFVFGLLQRIATVLDLNSEELILPVQAACPIPPTKPHCRSRSHAVPKGPGSSLTAPRILLTEENHGPTPQMLHCLPLAITRGTLLQFHSFDNAYVERLRAGDPRTQEHFQAYFTSLMRMKLRSRLRSPEAVEDVCQETFKRFFQALDADKIQQPERLGSYVNSMCNYVLLEHYRIRQLHTSLDDDDEPMDFPSPALDPLATFTAQEAQRRVREVLEQLSELDRRLLRQVFLEERDKDVVCREFGVTRDYLRVLLHRAKKSFKSFYEKKEGKGPLPSPAA